MKKLLLLLFTGMVVAAGCSDQRNITLKSADNTGVISGRVIDFSTQQPIANAQVILSTGGNFMVTKTISDSNPNQNLNKTGMFSFNGVPAGDYKLRIVATGYAVIGANGTMYYNSYTNSNNPVVYDYGNIPLYKGYNLDVYVNSNGTALSGIHVYTVVNDVICGNIGNSWFYSPEITATTDATGHATLSGLSQCEYYEIVAPATDVNGDGIYDYQTGIAYSPDLPLAGSNMALSLNMPPAQRYDSIQVLASSADNYPNLHYSANWLYDWYLGGNIYAAVAPQGDIVYVFNYPVSFDYASLDYYNVRVVNTDPNYAHRLNAPINATLSAGNTVLTIHPTSNLLVNNTYVLSGKVSANIGGALQTYALGSSPLTLWYVFDNTSTGVSSTLSSSGFTITADNFNGVVNSGVTSAVYLKFPEFVRGTYKILAYTSNGASTYLGSFGNQGNLSGSTNDRVYYEGNIGGCEGTNCGPAGLKVVYRVPLGINLADDSSLGGGAPGVNNVTVSLDLTDTEGNRYVTPAGGITLSIN